MNEPMPIKPNERITEVFDLIFKDLIKSLNAYLQEVEILPGVISTILKRLYAEGEDVRWVSEIMASIMDPELSVQDGDDWAKVYIINRMRKIRDLMHSAKLDINNFSDVMILMSKSTSKLVEDQNASNLVRRANIILSETMSNDPKIQKEDKE